MFREKFSFIFLGFVPLLFLLEIAVAYAPAPLSRINVLFIFLTWMIVYRNNISFYWLALIISIFSEFFSSYPFGISTAACLVSLFLARRLFFLVFANFNWYSIFILGFLSGLLYKIILFGLLFCILTVRHQSIISLSQASYSTFFDAFIGAIALLVIFLLSRPFIKNKYQYST